MKDAKLLKEYVETLGFGFPLTDEMLARIGKTAGYAWWRYKKARDEWLEEIGEAIGLPILRDWFNKKFFGRNK
jgi:hypothetical protein